MSNMIIYPDDFITSYCPSDDHFRHLPAVNMLVKMRTKLFGEGIFALKPYKRGDLIGSFIAEPIKDLRQHSLQRLPNDNLFDPYFVGYLLHSCSPNIVVDMHQQKVFCIRDIDVNEPLMMDYASTEDSLYSQFMCSCGTPNRRLWITGRNEAVNDVGMAYLISMSKDIDKQIMTMSVLNGSNDCSF